MAVFDGMDIDVSKDASVLFRFPEAYPTDCEIVSEDGKLDCHWHVVQDRWPFKSALDKSALDKSALEASQEGNGRTRTLVFKSISTEMMRWILQALYLQNVPPGAVHLPDLLVALDKLGLESTSSFNEILRDTVERNMCADNVLDCLDMLEDVEVSSIKDLRDVFDKYLLENMDKVVQKTPGDDSDHNKRIVKALKKTKVECRKRNRSQAFVYNPSSPAYSPSSPSYRPPTPPYSPPTPPYDIPYPS